MFHIGHIQALKEAKSLGDFVIVGLHDDQTIYKSKGEYPVLTLHERVLPVLACRHVDEVVIGAPYRVSKDLIKTLNISLVVEGIKHNPDDSGPDTYAVPKELGIFKKMESDYEHAYHDVLIKRIVANKEYLLKRVEKGKKKEEKYYGDHKEYVVEG